MVELPLYKEEQLTGASGDVYPLIIRLESITEPGKAEGHTLQVGAADPVPSFLIFTRKYKWSAHIEKVLFERVTLQVTPAVPLLKFCAQGAW